MSVANREASRMQSSPTSKMSALVFELQALIKLLNIFIQNIWMVRLHPQLSLLGLLHQCLPRLQLRHVALREVPMKRLLYDAVHLEHFIPDLLVRLKNHSSCGRTKLRPFVHWFEKHLANLSSRMFYNRVQEEALAGLS